VFVCIVSCFVYAFLPVMIVTFPTYLNLLYLINIIIYYYLNLQIM
jgi:hypothetical protein